jgi:hypothetical protein
VSENRKMAIQATSDKDRDEWIKAIVNNVDRFSLLFYVFLLFFLLLSHHI